MSDADIRWGIRDARRYEPAHPVVLETSRNVRTGVAEHEVFLGTSVRDEIAMSVLPRLIGPDGGPLLESWDQVADRSYEVADAMMRSRLTHAGVVSEDAGTLGAENAALREHLRVLTQAAFEMLAAPELETRQDALSRAALRALAAV